MNKNINKILNLLACVKCNNGKIINAYSKVKAYLKCDYCGTAFELSNGIPVLMHPDNKIFEPHNYQNIRKKKQSILGNFFPSPSVNLSRKRILYNIESELIKTKLSIKILVVGCGNQNAELNQLFGKYSFIDIIYCDVDPNADVTLFCDAHNLPFINSVFDCVITTAVLEHVLYPEVVASEILRVMKRGAYLYSEIPFMQQVHEGAYDFTRFTMSGHRRLFNLISEIESGLVAGPATAFIWATEYLFISFTSKHSVQKLIKFIIRPFIFWIKYFDYILVRYPQSLDSASCTFLFGIKSENKISDIDIIKNYNGVNITSHA